MKIPIIFGWLDFHRKEQWTVCEKPLLVCHWVKADWMNCSLYSKRIFCIGKKFDMDAYMERTNKGPQWMGGK
jgi:hypothetical protein